MLNELKTLADSIRAAGFSGQEWHDKFKEIKVKGSPCFVVSLSDDGEIAGIRFLDPDKAKVLRTWQGGSNGECFPCFNFLPFYELDEKKSSSLSPQQKTEAIQAFVSAFQNSAESPSDVGPVVFCNREKADKKTAKCLGSIAEAFFAISADEQDRENPFVRLRAAVSSLVAGEGAKAFNGKLMSFLRRNVSEELARQKDPPTIWSILFKKSPDVVLFFDLDAPSPYPIASTHGMATINARLLAVDASKTKESSSSATDAFGNPVSDSELSGKLPEVKLPGVIAVTKLRSMSGESKCQTRYGFIDAASFPVGDKIRKAAKSALAWIASPDREGKTWALAGSNELVFAYPKSMPKALIPLASLFGNGRSSAQEDITAEGRFETYAVDALSGLKTLLQSPSPNTEIEVFAIKKADKARRKVVFYRNYSLAMLEMAVAEWLAGARNIPDIRFLKWPRPPKGEKAKKGTKPVLPEFHAPLPLATVGLAYEVWSQDGNEKTEPKFRSAPLYKGLPVFDGLELFLGNPATTGLAKRMISLLLQNSGGLCAEVANLQKKDIVIANTHAAAHLGNALPLVGILLYKLNHTKETYMEKAPYLIGRFLNLADSLHKVWCKNVKKDDPLPPQLLGSTYFASFQQNPVQAFASMQQRLMPYWSWAETNRTPDIKRSRWLRREMGMIVQAIHEAKIPTHLSDEDRAEMLLGYLAYTVKANGGEPEDPDASDSPSVNS